LQYRTGGKGPASICSAKFLFFCVLLQSSGTVAMATVAMPTLAEKSANLKTMNANGDFADFNQQTIEQCMLSSLLMLHVLIALHNNTSVKDFATVADAMQERP